MYKRQLIFAVMGKRGRQDAAMGGDDHPMVSAVFDAFSDVWDVPEFRRLLSSPNSDELKEMKTLVMRGGHVDSKTHAGSDTTLQLPTKSTIDTLCIHV